MVCLHRFIWTDFISVGRNWGILFTSYTQKGKVSHTLAQYVFFFKTSIFLFSFGLPVISKKA